MVLILGGGKKDKTKSMRRLTVLMLSLQSSNHIGIFYHNHLHFMLKSLNSIHSRVRNCLDIDAILVILLLYTTTMDMK